jgi:hypothetical protein
MVQMNKKVMKAVAGSDRSKSLESDLIGDADRGVNQQELETGRRHVEEETKFQHRATKANSMLGIQQGFRRRHPHAVLGQYDGVMKTTSTAASSWEQALLYETERTEMPKEFRPKGDGDGMVNQVGVVTTALENYKASKGKFSRMHLIGV